MGAVIAFDRAPPSAVRDWTDARHCHAATLRAPCSIAAHQPLRLKVPTWSKTAADRTRNAPAFTRASTSTRVNSLARIAVLPNR